MSKPRNVMLLGAAYLQVLIVSCGSQPGTSARFSDATKAAGVTPVGTVNLIHIKGNDTVINPSPTSDPKLSILNNDTVTWINDTNLGYYVCFDPSDVTKQPFHAIVLFVPAGKQRDSGKIRDDATTSDAGVFYHVYKGPKMCTAPDLGVHGQPKIIIQP